MTLGANGKLGRAERVRPRTWLRLRESWSRARAGPQCWPGNPEQPTLGGGEGSVSCGASRAASGMLAPGLSWLLRAGAVPGGLGRSKGSRLCNFLRQTRHCLRPACGQGLLSCPLSCFISSAAWEVGSGEGPEAQSLDEAPDTQGGGARVGFEPEPGLSSGEAPGTQILMRGFLPFQATTKRSSMRGASCPRTSPRKSSK